MAQQLPLTTLGERCVDTGDAISDPAVGTRQPQANHRRHVSSRAFQLVMRPYARGGRNRRRRIAVREGTAAIMATQTKTIATTNGRRDHDLRKMLEDRRRELMYEVQGRIRDARTDIIKERQVLDQGESSEVDIQEDIEFALIQVKADTLNKIDVALRRLDEDTYGVCFECGGEIAERRLRALPFAVRCKDCEEARETAEQRERIMARRGSSSFVAEMSS